MNKSVETPDLRQLRIQAKELLRAVRAGNPDALARVVPYFRSAPTFSLVSAQLVLAREHGYGSWAEMKRFIEGPSHSISPGARLYALIESGEQDQALELLGEQPDLAGSWQKSEYGWSSPLHAAARLGQLEVVRALVDAGAEIYAVNQGDYPPVFEAVYRGHREVVDLLLESSAARDNGIPPTYGCGIDIVLATRLGLEDRVRMHVEKDPLAIYRRGCIGESTLHWPAHNGHVSIVELLLDHGAPIEVDEVGLYGGKPLHWAAEHAPACVGLLLKRGANPNSRNLMKNDFEGFTPLHMTASQPEECLECARQLLEYGADPSLHDAKGRKPLDVAREMGRQKVVDFLRA
ncbi:MAG TPA: ankyrin repeat domain-containing protein [Fimbriimonas sp.]|nr:ankyrin repeat domain-containing protein [Fimbriimonas sp.]